MTTWTNTTKNSSNWTNNSKNYMQSWLMSESGNLLLKEDGGTIVLLESTTPTYQTKNSSNWTNTNKS